MARVLLQDAEDATLTLLKAAVDGFTPGSGFTAPQVYYTDVDDDGQDSKFNPPAQGITWIRANFIPNTGGQFSLGGGENTKFRRFGILIHQVFTPSNRGSEENHRLCEAIMDAYDGIESGGVWFRDIRTNRVGNERGWFQQNVVGEWLYDDHKTVTN